MTEDCDFTELQAKYKAPLDEDYSNILIVGNLPKVDAAKEEKLMAVLKKSVFSKAIKGYKIQNIEIPKEEENGVSKGFLFMEVEDANQASGLLEAIDGHKLDKTHTLFAVRFNDYERLLAIDPSAEYREPEVKPFAEKEHLKSWMMDSLARDQFVALAGNVASIFWNQKADKPELCYQRSNWTEQGVQWSPRGSYLTTIHSQGVGIWGGEHWNKVCRFPHVGVQKIHFSPNEIFLVTWSPFNPSFEFNLMVWETSSGKMVRGYSLEKDIIWPIISFSYDDQYAARIGDDFLAIYETESFTVLDKKPVKVNGIKDMRWSPCDYSLAYWVPGTDNTPARVAIIQVPSRHIIRTKNLFNVLDCQLSWHCEGDFLGVLVTRYGKNKKQIMSSLELFRMRSKDIPVDVLELSNGDVLSVSFEPFGDRLLVAVKQEFKVLISFYHLNHHDKNENVSVVKLLKTLERKLLTKFLWSPRGDFILFTGMDSTSGFLEFWSVNDYTLLNSKEHFTATDAEWDPSGRFVISYISYSRFQNDNGFILWDFKGEQLSKSSMPKLSFMSWRPRPLAMLSKDEQKAIKKNLKAYSELFEQQDRQAADSSSSSAAAHRANLLSSWAAFKMRSKERFDGRKSLRVGLSSSVVRERQDIEEWMEEVIEEKEEVVRS